MSKVCLAKSKPQLSCDEWIKQSLPLHPTGKRMVKNQLTNHMGVNIYLDNFHLPLSGRMLTRFITADEIDLSGPHGRLVCIYSENVRILTQLPSEPTTSKENNHFGVSSIDKHLAYF